MKKFTSIKYKLLAVLVFMIGYTLAVFLAGNHTERGLDKAFITTYILMMIGVLVYLITLFISNNNKTIGTTNAVNGQSTMSFIFLIFSFISTSILYFINYSKVIVFVMVCYILMFTIFLMIYILSFKQQELISQNSNQLPVVFSIKELPVVYSLFIDQVKHEGIKKELELIINKLMSISDSEENKEIDKKLIEYSGFIKRNIEKDEYANVYNNISKINELIDKRNNLK